MNRREFLGRTAMAAAALPLARGGRAFPQPDTRRWRLFEPDILGSWDEGVTPGLTLVSRVAAARHVVDPASAGLELERVRIIAEATGSLHPADARARIDGCELHVSAGRDRRGGDRQPRSRALHLPHQRPRTLEP